MDLGKAIKEIRRARDISQARFAISIGVTQGHLSKVESGSTPPSIELLKMVSLMTNTPLAVLFWFTLTDEDVKSDRKEVYKIIKPAIDGFLKDIFS